MTYEPTLLRTTERLIRARLHYKGAPELVHIKVGSRRKERDIFGTAVYDLTACQSTVFGMLVPGVPDANRASCRKCLAKYKPKRGQPPVRGAAP